MDTQKKVESRLQAPGCGNRFNWNESLILDINELRLHEERFI